MAHPLETALAEAHAEHERKLIAIGDRARREVIEPFCHKWGLSFASGMGVWSFYGPRFAGDRSAPLEPEDGPPEGMDAEELIEYAFPMAFWQEFRAVDALLDNLNDGRAAVIASYAGDVPLDPSKREVPCLR